MPTWGSDDATAMGTFRKEDHAQSFGLLSSTNQPLFQLLRPKASAYTKVGLALKIAANSPPCFKQKPHRIVYTTTRKDNLPFNTADIIVAAPGDDGYLAVHFSDSLTLWMPRGEMETICSDLNDLSCRIPPTVWQALTESDQQRVILAAIPPEVEAQWGAASAAKIRHLTDLTLDKAAGPEVDSEAAQMRIGQTADKSVASYGKSAQKEAKLQAKVEELTSQVEELALSLAQLQSKQGLGPDYESPQPWTKPIPVLPPKDSSSNKPKPWAGNWEWTSPSTLSCADVNSDATSGGYWGDRDFVRTPDTRWGDVTQYKAEDLSSEQGSALWALPVSGDQTAESNTKRGKKRASEKQHVQYTDGGLQSCGW